MSTFKIAPNTEVTLNVLISSDANVGSNITLDEVVVKKSAINNFDVNLGNSNSLNKKVISGVSNFFVGSGPIDIIKENTIVEYTLSDTVTSKSFKAEKLKISSNLFMAYIQIELVKS
jgi:hypothetical protein